MGLDLNLKLEKRGGVGFLSWEHVIMRVLAIQLTGQQSYSRVVVVLLALSLLYRCKKILRK